MSLLRFAAMGTVVAGICCFTPALVIILSSAGAASMLGYLDFVLLPLLLMFLGLTVFAFMNSRPV